MTDNTQRSGSPDSKRINVNQQHELRDWAQSLGVTPDQVREAVRAVGDSSTKVKEFLDKKTKPDHPVG